MHFKKHNACFCNFTFQNAWFNFSYDTQQVSVGYQKFVKAQFFTLGEAHNPML